MGRSPLELQLPAAEHHPISLGATMIQLGRRSHHIVVAIFVSATCAASALAQSPSNGLIASDEGGHPGCQHSFERSRIVTGATDASLRHVEEHGFAKVVGPDGVFAISLHNGLAVGVPSGGANRDKGGAEPSSEEAKAGYMMDPDKHNRQVVDYFVSAGVPKDQIGGFHAITYLSSGGPVSRRPAPQTADGYASVLERKIGKYP